MSFIEVKNVSKSFKVSSRKAGAFGALANVFAPKFVKKQAVRNIGFTIEKGEAVGFIGPNGAGKSTTVKMLSGILFPDSGEINIDGFVPYKQRKSYVGKIGVVFGQKSQLQWDLPVIDSFELLKAIYNIPNELYQKNLDKFIEMLDMSGFINQPVRQLSLGQRMRADIAAVLLHSPEIVFFDEPTIGVDVIGKETIRSFIRELNEREKVTMIFTTHDMRDIEKTCKHLIIINEGEKIYDGSLSGLRGQYGTSRQLDVAFAENPALPFFENIRVEEIENNKKRFVFEHDKVNINELMNRLLSEYKVRDINISEPDIESVIREFTKKRMREYESRAIYRLCEKEFFKPLRVSA